MLWVPRHNSELNTANQKLLYLLCFTESPFRLDDPNSVHQDSSDLSITGQSRAESSSRTQEPRRVPRPLPRRVDCHDTGDDDDDPYDCSCLPLDDAGSIQVSSTIDFSVSFDSLPGVLVRVNVLVLLVYFTFPSTRF